MLVETLVSVMSTSDTLCCVVLSTVPFGPSESKGLIFHSMEGVGLPMELHDSLRCIPSITVTAVSMVAIVIGEPIQ